jgi:hypothetical protein
MFIHANTRDSSGDANGAYVEDGCNLNVCGARELRYFDIFFRFWEVL